MRINLYDWCLENNIQLIREWDFQKNDKNMCDFAYKSGLYAHWICETCGHEWSTKICNRTNGSGCPKCANMMSGKRTIERQIEKNGSLNDYNFPYMQEWDYRKNTVSPSDVAIASNQKFWWKCKKCGYNWEASPNARSKGHGCPECNSSITNQKKILFHLKRDGSFADNYPEFLKYWDFQSNDKSCYELTSKSTYVAHWHCPDCDYYWDRSIVRMSVSKGCPRCVENQNISSIQMKTQNYILHNYMYKIRHEKDCSIVPKNPKTNYPLPYDNEIIISDNVRLIIEVNGEQHYRITEYTKMDAKKNNRTPQEELQYVQWKDKYKKAYALNNGYYYLELPYWTFDDESYKTLIDEKIQSILNSTTQN